MKRFHAYRSAAALDASVPHRARTPHDPKAFRDAWQVLRRRIELLLALPLDKLDTLAREQALMRIAQETA